MDIGNDISRSACYWCELERENSQDLGSGVWDHLTSEGVTLQVTPTRCIPTLCRQIKFNNDYALETQQVSFTFWVVCKYLKDTHVEKCVCQCRDFTCSDYTSAVLAADGSTQLAADCSGGMKRVKLAAKDFAILYDQYTPIDVGNNPDFTSFGALANAILKIYFTLEFMHSRVQVVSICTMYDLIFSEFALQIADVMSLNAACGALTVNRMSVQLGRGSISSPSLLELGSQFHPTISNESGQYSLYPVAV